MMNQVTQRLFSLVQDRDEIRSIESDEPADDFDYLQDQQMH